MHTGLTAHLGRWGAVRGRSSWIFLKPFYFGQAGQKVGTGALSTSIQTEHAPWTSRGRGQTPHVCSQALPKGRTIEKVLGACAGFSALPPLPPLPHHRPSSLFSALTRSFLLWGTRASRWGNTTRRPLLTISCSHMLPPITVGVRAAPCRGHR